MPKPEYADIMNNTERDRGREGNTTENKQPHPGAVRQIVYRALSALPRLGNDNRI